MIWPAGALVEADGLELNEIATVMPPTIGGGDLGAEFLSDLPVDLDEAHVELNLLRRTRC